MTSFQEKQQHFDQLYASGGWDQMGSGPGSTPAFTQSYRRFLEHFLVEHNVKSVLDLGCGDWRFSNLIAWGELSYTGIDVAQSLIDRNTTVYGPFGFTFKCADIIDCDWPNADLIIVKDLIHHIGPADTDVLIRRIRHYPLVLFTLDVSTTGQAEMCGLDAQRFFAQLPVVFEFDRNVEHYRYGRKVTLLYTKSP